MNDKDKNAKDPKANPGAAPAVVPTMSERFTTEVIRRFGNNAGAVELSDYQKQLVQRYFIKADQALKAAERVRVEKNSKNTNHYYDNDLPCEWKNVDLTQLAEDVVFYARAGLDPCMKNFLSIIPFRAKKAATYTMTFIEGYEGKKYMSFELALDRPIAIFADCIYEQDVFEPTFKNPTDPKSFDSYIFKMPKPFARGELIGGFGYVQYDDPRKNILLVMSRKDILKRKPAYAAVEFWGGEKDIWKDGKKTGETEHVDGWFDEMAYKTVLRATCDLVGLDPKKINGNYSAIQDRRDEFIESEAEDQVTKDVTEGANKGDVVDISDMAEAAPAAADGPKDGTAPTAGTNGQQKMEGV